MRLAERVALIIVRQLGIIGRPNTIVVEHRSEGSADRALRGCREFLESRGFDMRHLAHSILLATGLLCMCHFWNTGSVSRWSPSICTKALIHFYLSIPSTSSWATAATAPPPHRPALRSKRRLQHRNLVSKYMLQLYHRRPDTDIVQAIPPARISGPLCDGGRILEFKIPPADAKHSLESAELLGLTGTIIRVRSLQDAPTTGNSYALMEIQRPRKESAWRAFNVTSAVVGRGNDTVKIRAYGRMTYRPHGDGPILLLNYSKTDDRAARQRRSVRLMPKQRDREDERREEKRDSGRRRRRDTCRRTPLNVDFGMIAYDEWVIAPLSYNAYQCIGKCYFPLAGHLQPTTHAILQTLMYGAIQQLRAKGNLTASDVVVSRACCVPIKLESMSMLYMTKGTTVYCQNFDDMIVVECGCR